MEIEKLKQKILDLAIRGKLVPQDPNDEPASVLIDRIRAEKEELIKQGKIKRSKEDSYIYKGSDNCYYEKVGDKTTCINDEIPFEIPNNWTWTRLRNILDVRDGTHDSPKYQSHGIPFVTSKNLKNGEIDFSTCKLITQEDADSFNTRSFVDDKDILFAMIGTIGNPTIVKKDREFAIKNVALFKNIDINCISEYWIKLLLEYMTPFMKKKTSSGLQPFVSLDFLRNYLVPIPPRQTQVSIIQTILKFETIVNFIIKSASELEHSIAQIKSKILDDIFGENSRYKSYYENSYLLGDILQYEQPAKYIVESTEYSDDYPTPVLTPGKTFILGYTNEKDGIYRVNNGSVIIFDDFTTASRIVDFDFKVKSSAMKILTVSDTKMFNIEYLYYLLQTIKVNNNTHKRYWISEFATKELHVHTIEQQKEIVNSIKSTFALLDKMSSSI